MQVMQASSRGKDDRSGRLAEASEDWTARTRHRTTPGRRLQKGATTTNGRRDSRDATSTVVQLLSICCNLALAGIM